MTGPTVACSTGQCPLAKVLLDMEAHVHGVNWGIEALNLINEGAPHNPNADPIGYVLTPAIRDASRLKEIWDTAWAEMRVAHGLPADPPAGDLTEARPCTCGG